MRFHFFIALSALVLGVVGASNTTSKSTNKSTKKKNKKKDKRDMNGGGGMKMMMMTKGE